MSKAKELLERYNPTNEAKILWKKDDNGYYAVNAEAEFVLLPKQLKNFITVNHLGDNAIEKIYAGNNDTLFTITVASSSINIVGSGVDAMNNAGLTRVTANGKFIDFVFSTKHMR